MRVRLTQIDGKLPNLALMKLASWHRAQGDEVHFTRHARRDLFEPAGYDRVYGSAIFTASAPALAAFRAEHPGAWIGGTGTDQTTVVEAITGPWERYDYTIYPGYTASIGFTQRGCRLNCGFCVVPKKEGRPRATNSIAAIWRGAPWPKTIVLLDNDFFGQPREEWRARIRELREGGFKVCFNQGLNVRLLDEEGCRELAGLAYYDDQFTKRRLYTAWDNLRDEEIFFRGVDMLERAGVPPRHLMVYMLVGYDPTETWARVFYRFERMEARGIKPYPMVYGEKRRGLPSDGHATPEDKTLGQFQRWIIGRYYQKRKDGTRVVAWADFENGRRHRTGARP